MNELFADGLVAMCIGMGTVLLFLCLMILVMFVMSFVIKKLNLIFPEVVPQTAGNKKSIPNNDSEIALAIISAIHRSK